MQGTVGSVMAQDLAQIQKLLQSAPHPCMTRLLGAYDTFDDQRFTLRFHAMKLIETTIEIDSTTAASHALVYACRIGNYELVRWIVQDLREIIDVNMLVNGKNTLEWAVYPVRLFDHTVFEARDARLETAIDICRYLIIQYGSKIDANRPDRDYGLSVNEIPRTSMLLRVCVNNRCADVVAYLITTYQADLIHMHEDRGIFKLLVSTKHDTEAELYLSLYLDLLAPNIFRNVIEPTAQYGSARVFEIVLGAYRSCLEPDQINCLLEKLCDGHIYSQAEYAYNKVEMVLDMWPNSFTPNTIKTCLVNQWEAGHRLRKPGNTCMAIKDNGEVHGRTAQLIVGRHTPLESEGVRIALAVCCLPENIELFDAVFDANLDQISANPLSYLRHTILECCSLDDIDMFVHILNRCDTQARSAAAVMAFEFWCEAGDLEVVQMLLESGDAKLTDCAQTALVAASIRGDSDLVELIIRYVGDAIDERYYNRAFHGACYSNHAYTVWVLSVCQDRIDFGPNTGFGLSLGRVKPGIISLLNSIFGTSLEPVVGIMGQILPRPKSFAVEYGWESRSYYRLSRV